MIEPEYFPQKIFIEKSSQDFSLTKRILRNTERIPKEIIDQPQNLIRDIKTSRNAIQKAKKYLLITLQRGKFVKPCPCTHNYIGCNYFIINLDLNCPLDCSYCILQHYLTNPLITVHVNLDDLWKQLDVFLYKNKERIIRIGTGELGDSLALDHITETSKDLVSYFRGKRNTYFELKTKTINVKNILKLEPAENIVISWSLNSSKIAEEEERGAPSIEERINAARKVSEKGYRVGFHFDPIIRYSGWEEDYEEAVKILLGTVDSDRIAWISLGSLRFPPLLKSIIKKRFPETKIIYDEFIQGKDGKLRYFRPIRLMLYKKIISFIKIWGGTKIPLYFCMEGRDVWREALNWLPSGKDEVELFLSSPPDQSKA